MVKRILILIAFAVAATGAAQTLSVGSATARCGQQVTIPVTVDAVSGMLSLEFRITYDSAHLTAASASTGSLTSGFSIASNASGGVLRVAMASGTPVTGGGTVAAIPFTLSNDATGSFNLGVTNVLLNDNPRPANPGAVSATCVQPPSTPVLLSPSNGATGVGSPVTLSWNTVIGASSYMLYFGTTFRPPLFTNTSATSQSVSTQPGTTYYWFVQANNDAGSATSAVWSFTTAGTACAAPSAPQVSAPMQVISGSSFDLTWPAVAGATEYVVDESSSPAFDHPTSITTSSTRLSLTRSATTDTVLYFRVHARNAGSPCNLDGPFSPAVAVRITPRPPLEAGTRVVPVVGSTEGSFGSRFSTSVQLHNPTNQRITGRLIFHLQGAEGSASDPSVSYSLGANETTSYGDIVMFIGFSHAVGSLDIVPDAGSRTPLSAVRVFNDGGAAGTTGMTIDQLGLADAVQAGQRGILIAPMKPSGVRMNIGIRTLLDGVTMTVTVLAKDGFMIQSTRRTFPATYFVQLPLSDFTGGSVLLGDEVVTFDVESGSALIYGAITDNVSQDPSMQIARPLPAN